MMENKTKIDLKNKSIFITGVAGFIGSNLAKRLLSTVEGVKVVLNLISLIQSFTICPLPMAILMRTRR